MTVLEARDVAVSFGGVKALQGVDLRVDAGEIVGIIGANGAGKTTLFDCLTGITSCSGTIVLDGADVTAAPVHERARAGLGRSFQDARLFHSMTVLDTLRTASERHRPKGSSLLGTLVGGAASRQGEAAATKRAEELVEVFGLGGYRDKLVGELSTGTRRIIDLACLLIQRPKVVLLDEPSSGIAQRETEALAPLLLRVRDELGCGLVLIEHDMPLVLSLATRLYALETGRVIAEGAPDDVVRDPAVVRSYLGDDPDAINRSG
ncbi:MAG: ABC-type branched-chain amino acid transport system, ATPase component [Frankiales bacterium]|jgi:branched-chain amino acid transport system ATP-binding protein|nr:ABC-type branched-chain amino acid transport system, ATPase component [Frankiales bacterium]